MNDEPLSPDTLESLRSVLTASPPPEIEPEAWRGLLQQALHAPHDAELHGDLTAVELVPSNWPDVEENTAAQPGGDDEITTDHVADPGWSSHDAVSDFGADNSPFGNEAEPDDGFHHIGHDTEGDLP